MRVELKVKWQHWTMRAIWANSTSNESDMVARENVLAIAYGMESSYLHGDSIWVALGNHIHNIATSGSTGPRTMCYRAQQSHIVGEVWVDVDRIEVTGDL